MFRYPVDLEFFPPRAFSGIAHNARALTVKAHFGASCQSFFSTQNKKRSSSSRCSSTRADITAMREAAVVKTRLHKPAYNMNKPPVAVERHTHRENGSQRNKCDNAECGRRSLTFAQIPRVTAIHANPAITHLIPFEPRPSSMHLWPMLHSRRWRRQSGIQGCAEKAGLIVVPSHFCQTFSNNTPWSKLLATQVALFLC